MDEERIRARHRELSARQAKYVANRAKGMPRDQSAILAGYADTENIGRQVEESSTVQAALKEAQAETAEAVNVTKEDIARGLLSAAALARQMADPGSLVRAYTELGKMLGHYAPEVKKVEHGVGKETLEALERMSDRDLLRLSQGTIVDGEVTGRE